MVLKSTVKLAFSGFAFNSTARVTVFPANGTIENKNINFDDSGKWAKSGVIIDQLLEDFLKEEFFIIYVNFIYFIDFL